MTAYNGVLAQIESIEKIWGHEAALFAQPGMLDAYEARRSAEYCNLLIDYWQRLITELGGLALPPPEAA